MDDLLDRLRVQVERAAEPIGPDEVRAARRPSRARLVNVAAVAALVAVLAGLVALRSDRGEPRAEPPMSGQPTPEDVGRSVERIEVQEVGEAIDVEIVFDGDLPVGDAAYVDDITSVQDPGFSFTTQSMEGTVWQCATRHWGFGPGAVGRSTVDVLIPSYWFDPDVAPVDGVTYVDGQHVGKIVACGPHKGYVQYSITSVSFDAREAVSVGVDGRSIRVRIEAPASGA